MLTSEKLKKILAFVNKAKYVSTSTQDDSVMFYYADKSNIRITVSNTMVVCSVMIKNSGIVNSSVYRPIVCQNPSCFDESYNECIKLISKYREIEKKFSFEITRLLEDIDD